MPFVHTSTTDHHFTCPRYTPWNTQDCDCSHKSATERDRNLGTLRHLLSYPSLGAWGMEALNDLLPTLIPDLDNVGHSTIGA